MSKIVAIFVTNLIWDNMEKIFVLLISLMTLGVLGMLICAWNTSYCFVFLRREWRQWEELIKNKDKIAFKYHYVFGEHSLLNNCEFIGEMYGKNVKVKYWEYEPDGGVSVFDLENEDCILCDFDRYHVRKMQNILEKELEKEIAAFNAGKQLITEVARDYLID
jgi:hypothetical protein